MGRFLSRFVTIHTFNGRTDRRRDRQTDGQTDGRTEFSSLDHVCNAFNAAR